MPVPVFEPFFRELDVAWRWPTADRIPLKVLGSAALMLQADYERGTRDGDVLETAQLTDEIQGHLLQLAGPGSTLDTRHRVHIDIVKAGIPFLPQAPLWHPMPELNESLQHFEIHVLDVVDVMVSKLKRFNANDVSDIEAMIELDLVAHAALLERFELAVDWFGLDARASEIPRYVKNLHRVERDLFAVEETEIELPGWI